jgi:hypothetical protein
MQIWQLLPEWTLGLIFKTSATEIPENIFHFINYAFRVFTFHSKPINLILSGDQLLETP